MASLKRLDYIDTSGNLRVHRADAPHRCKRKIDTMLGSRLVWSERYQSGTERAWGDAKEAHGLETMDNPRTIND